MVPQVNVSPSALLASSSMFYIKESACVVWM